MIRANARIRHILDVVTVDQLLFTRQLKRSLKKFSYNADLVDT